MAIKFMWGDLDISNQFVNVDVKADNEYMSKVIDMVDYNIKPATTVTFYGKHPKMKTSLEQREENGITIFKLVNKEESLSNDVLKERSKFFSKIGREPDSVFMNTTTLRNLLIKAKSEAFYHPTSYRDMNTYGMKILTNNYLDDGQIIPYKDMI